MQLLSSKLITRPKRPVRILQFGDTPFIRGFADWFIQLMNEEAGFSAGSALVTSLAGGSGGQLFRQDGCYTLVLDGLRSGREYHSEKIISVIDRFLDPYDNCAEYLHFAENAYLRFVISDTGKLPEALEREDIRHAPKTYPGQLLGLMYRRYQHFGADRSAGFWILPLEAARHNGRDLREALLRLADLEELEPDFRAWVAEANHFCDTAGQRLVREAAKDEIKAYGARRGYTDKALLFGDYAHRWAIAGAPELKKVLPFRETRTPLNIILKDELGPEDFPAELQ